MRPRVRRFALLLPLAAAAVGAVAVDAVTGGAPAAAQQAGELPAPPEPGSARMHRTRAVATWKRYVWSLDRPLLAQVVADLEQEVSKKGRPADFTAALLMAHGYVLLARPEPAARSLARATEIAPAHPGIQFVRALMAQSESRRDSIELFDAYLEQLASAPPDREFGTELLFLGHLHRGALQMFRGQSDAAAHDLQRAFDICSEAGHDPPGPLVQRLARAHQALGEYARAEELVRELLRRDPADPVNYVNMGVLYYEQDRFEEARRWYEAALARKQTLLEPHLRLAYLASVDRDLPRLRSHIEIFERLAKAAAGDGPVAEAVQVEIHAAYGSYWRALASRLSAAGSESEAERAYDRARRSLDAALEIEPTCVRALTLRLQVAAQTGEDPARVEAFRNRLDAVQSPAQDAPRAFRGVFC